MPPQMKKSKSNPYFDEKPLKFSGIHLGIFCAATSPPMYLVFFSDFQNVWIRY
jgi:hypothetical protein